MKLAIVMLCASGIILKYHYSVNPKVTTQDMVFVRAFSQLIISYILCKKDKVDYFDLTPYQRNLIIVRTFSGLVAFAVFNSAVKMISLSKLAFL